MRLWIDICHYPPAFFSCATLNSLQGLILHPSKEMRVSLSPVHASAFPIVTCQWMTRAMELQQRWGEIRWRKGGSFVLL